MFSLFEIDFLAVGDASNSGDAITLRFGNPPILRGNAWTNQQVVIVDGGYQENGIQLADHIKNYYGTNTVDWMFLTHPDLDHVSGLCDILANDRLKVKNLVMHQPWDFYPIIKDVIDQRATGNSFSTKSINAYKKAYELLNHAIARKVKIHESYSDENNYLPYDDHNFIRILGPSKKFYTQMVLDSGKTHEQKYWPSGLLSGILIDAPTTTPENNMSKIIYIQIADIRILLTGDAGVTALKEAITCAQNNGINLQNLHLFQIPHHGSRLNFDKSILDKISADYYVISASYESDDHPSEAVIKEFNLRGLHLYTTEGSNLVYPNSGRDGWGRAIPINTFTYKLKSA